MVKHGRVICRDSSQSGHSLEVSVMLRIVELEDGTFMLLICIDTGMVKYHEVTRFEKLPIADIPEKSGGYCVEFQIVTE